jgi:hypothetical protein
VSSLGNGAGDAPYENEYGDDNQLHSLEQLSYQRMMLTCTMGPHFKQESFASWSICDLLTLRRCWRRALCRAAPCPPSACRCPAAPPPAAPAQREQQTPLRAGNAGVTGAACDCNRQIAYSCRRYTYTALSIVLLLVDENLTRRLLEQSNQASSIQKRPSSVEHGMPGRLSTGQSRAYAHALDARQPLGSAVAPPVSHRPRVRGSRPHARRRTCALSVYVCYGTV